MTESISIRIDSDLLGRARDKAQEKGVTLSQLIRKAVAIKLRREGCA